jgi:hypothetical protein
MIPLSALLSLAAGALAAAPRPPDPVLGKVVFEPVVIHNVKLPGVMRKMDKTALRDKMSKQFDAWMVRSITRTRLAAAAEPIGQEKPAEGEYVLHTVMNVPLMQRDLSNVNLQIQTGKFMDFEMTLSDSSGKVVAEAKSNLVWGDGDWARSALEPGTDAPQQWIETPRDKVLTGYVRMAVERGVKYLLRDLHARQAHEKLSAGGHVNGRSS